MREPAVMQNKKPTDFKRKIAAFVGVKHWQLWVLILPALAFIVLFCYVPMYGIVIAWQRYNPIAGIGGSPWVGWQNFKALFESYYFGIMIKNTLIISLVSLLINTPLPILFALMINEIDRLWYKKAVQTISYAPYFVSVTVVVGMCFSFTNPDYGIINKLLGLFGLDPVAMMYENGYFKAIYIISNVWQGLGWWSIVYVATLSSVDPALHEAAKIDGASRIKRIWHINLPALVPTIVILTILAIGNSMSIGFDKIFLMQTSGNIEASEVISTYAYKVSLGATGYKNYGFGTATGLFNSVINVVLLLIANTVSKAVGKESLW